MFNRKKKIQELRSEFDMLVWGMRRFEILKPGSLDCYTENFNKLMGTYGSGAISRIDILERKIADQQETINLLMARLHVEKITKPEEVKLITKK